VSESLSKCRKLINNNFYLENVADVWEKALIEMIEQNRLCMSSCVLLVKQRAVVTLQLLLVRSEYCLRLRMCVCLCRCLSAHKL